MGTEENEDHTVVYLGNRDTIEAHYDPETGKRTVTAHPGKRCTTVKIPAEMSILAAANEIIHPNGVWTAHSTGTPAWVASTNQGLAQLLAAHFKCELRDPEPDHVPSGDGRARGEEG